MKKMLSFLLLSAGLWGCGKEPFLDAVPDKAQLIPRTLPELQDLLDNTTVFNITPGITNIADGDLFTTDAAWKTWSIDAERNSYTWSADIWGTVTTSDWDRPFQQILYANVVLDQLARLPAGGADQDAVKGGALFARAFAYYQLLQEFTLPYRAATAGSDLGLPLRLVPDVDQRPPRSSLQASYEQVLRDLRAARGLLPASVPSKSRPSLAAAYALLAKTCLVMGDYPAAGAYADSCLRPGAVLLDYNTLDATAARPFPRSVPTGNNELLYYSSAVAFSSASNAATLVDTLLYRSYAANDLRKGLFFKASGPSGTFKGNYSGIVALFSGIAADEVYLIRAECAARAGNVTAALGDLNTLLVKRWKSGTFVPLTAADKASALQLVLTERRKELVGRLVRWSDLKRLGDSTLTRRINGSSYSLAPGSPRYAYPIPFDETSLSGLAQNAR